MKNRLINLWLLVCLGVLVSCGGGDSFDILSPSPFLHAQSTYGSGKSGSYTPANFYSHYAIPGNTAYNPLGSGSSTFSSGGYGSVIAIVDAPGSPAATVISDLIKFNQSFTPNLPALTSCTSTTSGLGSGCNPSTPFITVIDFSGGVVNSGWQGEIALDTQWAHAFAPRASIVLVISKSASGADLATAQALAASLPNVVAVSMSYGGNEPSASYDAFYDASFKSQIASYGVTFLAATGDSGDWGSNKSYPAASPYVTAVGGTSTSGILGLGETAWANGGGGPSTFETMPSYQSSYLQANGSTSFLGSITAATCSGTPSVCTAAMTVTSVSYGTLAVGHYVVGKNITVGSYISALVTGSGGTGTYTITTPSAQAAVVAGTTISSCGGASGGLAGRLCTLAGQRGMPDVSANADPGTYGNWTATIPSGSFYMQVTALNGTPNIAPGMALYSASSAALTASSRFDSSGVATPSSTSASQLVIVTPKTGTNTGGLGYYIVMPLNCLQNLLIANKTPSYSQITTQAGYCMSGTTVGGSTGTSYSGLSSATNNVQGYMQSPVSYYVNGTQGYVGGTSEATPMWAGVIAQMASAYSGSFGVGVAGWKSLIKAQTGGYGFNNYLYNSGQVNNVINDVILGTNYTASTGSKTSGCAQFCTADVGWDAVTGLGSPNVTQLISLLK